MAKGATEAKASGHIQKTRARESRLTKDGKYRDTCSDGFKGPDMPDGTRWEAHHIICEHAMAARDTNQYVENCLWISPWDINDAHNLIGLPRNREFRMEGTKRAAQWVSHQVDHNTENGYTEECRGWLQENVFNDLNTAGDKKNHTFDADDISEQLRKGTDYFKGELEKRAKRLSGIAEGWKNRFEKEYERTWYHPFSMAVKPRHRSPGVEPSKIEGVFKLLS